MVLITFIIYSCTKDGTDGSLKLGDDTCEQFIHYNTNVNTFAVFDVPDNQLTETELMLKIPKTQYFDYRICKKADGALSYEIKSIPELSLKPKYHPNTIGVTESLKWKMVKANGLVTIYDENDREIESYSSNENGSIDDLKKIKEFDLIPSVQYEQQVQIMKENMTIKDVSLDVFVVTNVVNGLKTETYIDKRFQKEVIVAHYDSNNSLNTKNTYIYNVDNNRVKMTHEIFETYKKSMDSNNNMIIVELTEYIYD
jgi:hypothetical protein